MSVREIARSVGVSRSTASLWLRGIPLTPDQRATLEARNPIFNRQARGAQTNAALGRERRAAYQDRGRRRMTTARPLYVAGCALYWAEGEKSRNSVRFSNADPWMIHFFLDFLRREFQVPDESVRLRLHVYPDHEGRLEEIESFWLNLLGLDRACLNRSAVNVYSRASKRKRMNMLPYGTCRLSVCSTEIVQTIFGSIQELGGFDRPEWLG